MNAAENITRAYGGDWHGSYGSIPTPGNSNRDRGTTVRDADGGGVFFHSFNGGDWRALKEDCERRGLLPGRERTDRNRDLGAWDYTDVSGVVLYRKVRTALPNGQKSYRFEHPNGRGGWNAKRGDAPLVPYRLPDLVAAPLDAVIYMAEGEKQADKLASWGLIATSSKDWRGFDFAGYVKGRTVVILPDNDEQGAKIAADAKAAVERAEGTAFLLDLPGLPPKGDIMDWTGTVDDLRALTDAVESPKAETFPIADLAAWATTPPTAKTFKMDGFIPDLEVTLATGPGGANKSTFGLQLCLCSAAGLPMLGVPVIAGPALYFTAEDEDRENHWRVSKMAGALNTPLTRVVGRLHIVSLRGRPNNELATFDSEGRIKAAPAFAMLRATIKATGSKLVVLDNVAHLYIGNENDRGQVTAFVNLLYQLCREEGVTIVLIGHPNKQFLQGNQDGNATSGSTAWLNAVRSQLLIQRPKDGHDPDARVLTLGKANYARPDQQLAFRWHDFALLLDSDLSVDSRAELARTVAASTDNAAFLACLKARNDQHRAVSEKVSPTYAPKVFADMAEAKGVSKKRLEQAMERLFRIKAIERAFLWNGDDRKPVHGLRETAGDVQSPAQDPENGRGQHCAGDVQATAGDLTAPTVPNTYTIPKGISGAAHGAAAPYRDEDGRASDPPIFTAGRPARGLVLAPGEAGDDAPI